MPLSVDWSVTIDGINATSRFNPYVMELEVQDGAGATSDTARITMADDGRIIMPRKGATMAVTIMGQAVFTGKTESPRFSYGKGDGGRLIFSAKAVDLEKGAKEGKHFAKEDGTLEDYLKEFAKKAGLSGIKVDPALAKIKRPIWVPEGRSFLHELQRLGREYGATGKIQDGKAVFAKRGSGMTPSGRALPTIQARLPGNLISVDIEPFEARAVVRDVRLQFFDRKSAKFKEEKVDIDAAGATGSASAVIRGKRADKEDAKDRGEGRKAEADRDKGGGTVEIDINPQARAEGTCIVSGVRSGIDGTYRIETATHTLRSGDGGSTTKLELKQPGDKAGKDSRKAGD